MGSVLSKLKALWTSMTKDGMYMPFVHDARTGKPSITLLFAYFTFALAFISTITLHFTTDVMVATFTSILFWVIAVIFYRLRNLDKAKIDLDDKSIELSGNNNDNNNNED